MSKEVPGKLILGPVEVGYVHVFQPYKGQGTEAKYSLVIIIPKSATELVANIKNAIKEAYARGQAEVWNGKGPDATTCKIPLRDGDKEKPDDEVFKGCYFINASSKTAPGLIDKANRDLRLEGREDEMYSGMKAYVSVTFYPFSNSGNKGIACGLNNVMKFADGPHRGGRSSASNDFAELIEAVPEETNTDDTDWLG